MLLAVKLSQSKLAETIVSTEQPNSHASKNLSFGTNRRVEVIRELVSAQIRENLKWIVPLEFWYNVMEKLTGLPYTQDIRPIYNKFFDSVFSE